MYIYNIIFSSSLLNFWPSSCGQRFVALPFGLKADSVAMTYKLLTYEFDGNGNACYIYSYFRFMFKVIRSTLLPFSGGSEECE